jgi:hypothetical protein
MNKASVVHPEKYQGMSSLMPIPAKKGTGLYRSGENSIEVRFVITARLQPGHSTHRLMVWALAVVSHEVVDVEAGAADGCHLVEASMGSMPVVVVDPGEEVLFPFF